MFVRQEERRVSARLRMSLCVIVSAAALAVSACTTTRSDPRFASIDWGTLETQQRSSDAIGVVPEIDPFNLRIPLVTVEKTVYTGIGIYRRTTVEHPVSPVGVMFGNGLALDTEGNLFLDVLALVKVDLRKDFDLRCGDARLLRSGASFQLFEPFSSPASVTLGDSAMTLKAGLNTWGYTLNGSTYKYSSPGLLAARFEVTASAGSVTIVVAKLFPTTYAVSLADRSAAFSPYYKVTKSGDAYLIDGLGDNLKSYKLYYAGDRIIFCEGETVLKEIQLDHGGVLVDGRKVITLTQG